MRAGGRPLASLLAWVALLGACDATAPPQAPPLEPPLPTGVATSDGACDEPEVDGASVVRFTLEGSCLTGDVMVLFRCSARGVPVLRLAGEKRAESFLGGPFAVPVDTLPANVRFIGRGDGTEVMVSDPAVVAPSPQPSIPGSPQPSASPAAEPEPLVYVRHDGVTERWLRLERPGAVADPPIAWLIGDSILDGGRDVVSEDLADWSLTLDAEPGRPSSEGIPLAAEALEQEADVVLVELGTNDASASAFRGHLSEILDVLRGVPLVLWQTARGPEENLTIGQVNDAIRQVVPLYANTAIADWEAFVPVEELMDDGIHPQDGSEGLEAELLTPILSGWRRAVSGTGPTECSHRVVRATR